MVNDGRIDSSPLLQGGFAEPIEIDLYCPVCGYNLRGLSENPVRCPECGENCDRRIITVPAEKIRPALLKMETAPATGVGIALVYVLLALPFLLFREPAPAIIFAFPFLLAWLVAYRRTQSVFRARLGWTSIVRDFHLATLCWFLACWFFVSILRDYLTNGTLGGISFIYLLVMLGFAVLGVMVYRNARATICRLQRQQAVEMMRLIHYFA